MIIGRYLLSNLLIYLKVSTKTIEQIEGPNQGCSAPNVNIDDYDFEPINKNMLPFSEESFLDEYLNKCHESKPVRTEKADLNKRINEHCQHLTVTKQTELGSIETLDESFFSHLELGQKLNILISFYGCKIQVLVHLSLKLPGQHICHRGYIPL